MLYGLGSSIFLCLGLGGGLWCSVSEGLGLPSSVFERLLVLSSYDFEGLGLVERALSELSLDSTRRGQGGVSDSSSVVSWSGLPTP